jgi:hypothetical protein
VCDPGDTAGHCRVPPETVLRETTDNGGLTSGSKTDEYNLEWSKVGVAIHGSDSGGEFENYIVFRKEFRVRFSLVEK